MTTATAGGSPDRRLGAVATAGSDSAQPVVGSLCTGAGGLDLGVLAALGAGRIAWCTDPDPHIRTILAARLPGVPNLGDLRTVDWTQVEPVDVLTAGFPCQDISAAGHRAGIDKGARSGLWTHIVAAVRLLRPALLVVENVAALRWKSGGLHRVLGDLATLGFDALWRSVRAADIGAPHRRERVFLLYLDSRGAAGCKFTRLGAGLARWLRLLVGLFWVTLGLEDVRRWQRSAGFSVAGPAVIRKLRELDRHHGSPTEAVSGRRILSGDDPDAGPGLSGQWRSVQVCAGNDDAELVPESPGNEHSQAEKVGHLDLFGVGGRLRHVASWVQGLPYRKRAPDCVGAVDGAAAVIVLVGRQIGLAEFAQQALGQIERRLIEWPTANGL